jgi:hypothetical protein
MSHHKLEIVIKISKLVVIKISKFNCINHLDRGLIMFFKDLNIGYNKIDFKDHALFKVKDTRILIQKLIDPKGNQISYDINLLIISSNVYIVELIVSLDLNVQLEMLFAICAIKSAIFQGFANRHAGFRHNRGTRSFEISSRTGTQK